DGHLVGRVVLHTKALRRAGLPRWFGAADALRGPARRGVQHPSLLGVHGRGRVRAPAGLAPGGRPRRAPGQRAEHREATGADGRADGVVAGRPRATWSPASWAARPRPRGTTGRAWSSPRAGRAPRPPRNSPGRAR